MGDNVADGVKVGVRVMAVAAAVWELARLIGAAATAVLVNADTMVCAMAVPREFESRVGRVGPVTGMLGRPQARETINKTVTDKRIGVGFRKGVSFRLTGLIITPKTRKGPLKRGTSGVRGLFRARIFEQLGRIYQLLYTAKRMTTIKSPLRYPGGKSRAIQRLENLMPEEFDEFREPFVGGGSFFIHLKQKRPDLKIWINDLNLELYYFWKYAKKDSEKLADEVAKMRNTATTGQELFDELVKADIGKWSASDRAVRFFILNRITFSGVVEAGGYSQQAFDKRFTPSSIRRLAAVGKVLDRVKITHKDYSELLKDESERIFTFLDPPYFTASKSKLYGKNGALHTGFNHDEFARQMKKCKQSWLITYDESDEVRTKFAFAHIGIYPWQLQYGMNNYKQIKAEKGNELFIANYDFLKL